MPWSLKRFQQSQQLHFVTFSCFRRKPKLGAAAAREIFEQALERTRREYDLFVIAYVVMPEHVHLLVSETGRGTLARAIQSLKQGVSRRMALQCGEPFFRPAIELPHSSQKQA